jgi:hypothetical protein
MRPLRAPAWLLVAAVALGCPLSCTHERPPAAGDLPPGDAGAAGGGGLDLGDAAVEPAGPCGEQNIPAIENPPNISFVIDRSASMTGIFGDSGLSKYQNARLALSRVLKAIGHRVEYGLAVFPGLDGETGCEAGQELIEVGPGDDPSYARDGETGPILEDLLRRLQIAGTAGGTPAAPTLSLMLPILTELSGETFVVLVTDGAPNCNAELACGPSGCIPNIEGLTAGGLDCTQAVNCCAPTPENPQAHLSCVDSQASIDAVTALADVGISTFVVGMPGSEPYVELLDALAEAGGTARAGSPKYFSVIDTEELEASLKAIAASVAISCELPLDYEPPDPDYVNVYFDGQLIQYDPIDGWEWTEEGHVAIRGTACEQLGAGDVLEVQILAGCKTEVK